MRIAAAAGRGARLTPEQAADVVIKMDAVNGELATDFKVLDCPAAFILGTGGHSGALAEEMSTLRASAAVAQAASQRVSVFATVLCNHTAILRKCPAGNRPALHPRRSPNPPQRPRLEWSLNRYNSGQSSALAGDAYWQLDPGG